MTALGSVAKRCCKALRAEVDGSNNRQASTFALLSAICVHSPRFAPTSTTSLRELLICSIMAASPFEDMSVTVLPCALPNTALHWLLTFTVHHTPVGERAMTLCSHATCELN